ncbi:MAG: hypothetical protein GEV12_17220 [Micromonosporaceae bacterium]|nr:hypothetical protein [Micromonosporaceae bacterium]
MTGSQDRLEQRPDPAEPMVGTVSTALATGDLDQAHQQAEQGWRHRPDHIQLQDLLIASLDHRGGSERALELSVDNAARRIEWLARSRVTRRHRHQLGPAQRILFAGFFRSGSSAVLDCLRGVPGTTRWTPTGEMRLLKAPGGVADLVRRCETQGGLTDSDLVDFYLHLTGWKLTRHPPGTFHSRDVVNRHSAVLFRNRRAFGYLQTCLESFLELVDLTTSTKPTAADLVSFFRDAVGRALDAAATDAGAEVVLINQTINAWRLPLSQFLPPSTFVIVHRDPRDQYVDVRQVQGKPGLTPTTAELFARDYRRNRELTDRDVPRIAQRYGHRSYRLSFEDFVLDHERQVRALTDALGLARPRGRTGHYLPSRGRDGVGQHIGAVSPSELATLTEALPEYLDPRTATGGNRRR